MKPLVTLLCIVLLTATAETRAESATVNTEKHVIAEVLGRIIMAHEKDQVNGLVFGALLEKFAKDNKIEPTAAELDAFILKTEEQEKQQQLAFEQDRKKLRAELKSSTISKKERKDKVARLQTIEDILQVTHRMKQQVGRDQERLRVMKREMAHQFVRSWKLNKALYAKYGGRVIFQQAGPEPLDAYRDFLKEMEQAGSFRIIDKSFEAPFWRYFTNDAMHNFYSEDDGEKFINTPWWLMEVPPD